MKPPLGFVKEFGEGEVCKLRKALYGLKQSPRAWFGRFTLAMQRYGYVQNDMIITRSDVEEIHQLRRNLFREFEMKDLGGLKYFLGIEVLRSRTGIFISQRKYVLDLLAETWMLDCKPIETPIQVNHKLKIEESGEPAEKKRYQRLVGKLIYLSHTRPDIAYAVGVVSQFMHQPQREHMEAVIRILRYLKGTSGLGIMFGRHGHLDIKAYTDVDWAGNPNDRRSTSGYLTLVGECEIDLAPSTPSPLKCDNRAAISISENPVQHDRTKHVEVDRHFIKEKWKMGLSRFRL
ncbi:hypothetical protein K2173_003847 [Erythroxylum novogranatense]|uniref:Reverse transcriptase Ty1/copia-type domain-containing protein n=1 Tax=Erythroxylum novogranatense TaxID=1862640 RepID=A0AAV8S3S2_9ROSI|nr:hypothetical protein K2173_003847 [Erythroxylum novogranatense]